MLLGAIRFSFCDGLNPRLVDLAEQAGHGPRVRPCPVHQFRITSTHHYFQAFNSDSYTCEHFTNRGISDLESLH